MESNPASDRRCGGKNGKSVVDIRSELDRLRSGNLRAGVIMGVVGWLMWISVAVAVGWRGTSFLLNHAASAKDDFVYQ